MGVRRSRSASTASWTVIVLACGAALAGCSTRAADPTMIRTDGAEVITPADIQAAGISSVWDALKLSRTLHVNEDAFGRPTELAQRGQGSISLSDIPLIVIDGARVSDFRRLQDMPAGDVAILLVFAGNAASKRYGSAAASGLIEVYTKH